MFSRLVLSSIIKHLLDVLYHSIFLSNPLLVVGVTTMSRTHHAAGWLIFRYAAVEYSIMQGDDRQQPGILKLSNRVPLLVGSEWERRRERKNCNTSLSSRE